jgi:hypothetical protein
VAATAPFWAHIGLTLWAYVRNGRPPKQMANLPCTRIAPTVAAQETNLGLES